MVIWWVLVHCCHIDEDDVRNDVTCKQASESHTSHQMKNFKNRPSSQTFNEHSPFLFFLSNIPKSVGSLVSTLGGCLLFWEHLTLMALPLLKVRVEI